MKISWYKIFISITNGVCHCPVNSLLNKKNLDDFKVDLSKGKSSRGKRIQLLAHKDNVDDSNF